MFTLFKTILAILISISMQLSVSDAVEVSPQTTADEFLSGITTGDDAVIEQYLDNEYLNFIVNTKGDEDLVKRMNTALFANLSYEIEAVASNEQAAVAKVKITGNDFSNVMKRYKKASYNYTINHLYDEKVTNKKKFRKQCLRIYIEQIEKLSEKEPSLETEIYLPMVDDGYGGWTVLLTDDIMKTLIGDLAIPDME